MITKKKKPVFNVLNAGFKKRVKFRWRRPRGTDNKKRIRCSSMGAAPRIGYKNSFATRGMHPSGMMEVLVHNPAELKALAVAAGPENAIASTAGENSPKTSANLKRSAVSETASGPKMAARIASGVGNRKREEMKKLAAELKIRLLN